MISHYETNAEYPPTHVVIALAKALCITPDELLGFAEMSVSEPTQTREEKRLWKTFQRVLALPEKDRRAVIRLVNSLAQSA